jgi:hypothetical protein
MLSRLILTATAAFLCALGLALDFLPQETAAFLQLPTLPAITVLIQSLAALYLALGYFNWLSRKHPVGGIYSRPLALTNMLAFGITAIPLDRALIHASLPSNQPLLVDAAATLFTFFALAYIYLIFFHNPIPANPEP